MRIYHPLKKIVKLHFIRRTMKQKSTRVVKCSLTKQRRFAALWSFVGRLEFLLTDSIRSFAVRMLLFSWIVKENCMYWRFSLAEEGRLWRRDFRSFCYYVVKLQQQTPADIHRHTYTLASHASHVCLSSHQKLSIIQRDKDLSRVFVYVFLVWAVVNALSFLSQ